jgi:hypothetical protein
MPAEQVQPPNQGHDLQALWQEVKGQVPKKLGAGVWPKWDHKFVEQCIEEFHILDPSSERLRYKHVKSKPASPAEGFLDADISRRAKKHAQGDPVNPVRVDWSALLHVMEHVRDVLEAMDSYLIETHGMNAEWQAEQKSW